MITDNLKKELHDLKDQVIGIMKNPGSGRYELVLSEDTLNFSTIHITNFGSITSNKYPKSIFKFSRFPDNKNLNQVMEDPFQFDEFVRSIK